MPENSPHLVVYIDTSRPIELGDFVSGFVALGNQYEKFLKRERPDLKSEARFYVKEVRSGSIEAELVGFLATAFGSMISTMDQVLIFEEFVRTYRERISAYFQKGGRAPDASKSDLADFHKTVAAVANDPTGNAALQAAVYEDGKRKIRAAFTFTTAQARTAEREIAAHRLEIEQRTDTDHERVLMRFVRSSIQAAKAGKRSGELVIVDAVSPRALPIVYASELAESRIKHEIKEADENVYKKGFEVSLNVELVNDKPAAYRVIEVHDVIELPDDVLE